MEGKLPPGTGIVILLAAATCFAANHVSARIAFDHGATVVTGVTVRATATAVLLFVMMRLQGVAIALPRELQLPALIAGLGIAAQSYCLYSAVAIIPPALALLVFQTSPMLYLLLTWLLGKESPRLRTLPPMLLALAGLVLALNLRLEQLAARWSEIGTGVAWAFAGGASMTLVYFLNANQLKAVDGRLRTFVMTAVTAVLVAVAGTAADAQALPKDPAGLLGLVLLAIFYCIAMTTLFSAMPRVSAASTAALNFEPIALLALGWVILGHGVTPLQVIGAFVTVTAIAWLGVAKK